MSGREQVKRALNDENEKLQAQLEQMEGKGYAMDQMSNDYQDAMMDDMRGMGAESYLSSEVM